MLEQKGPGIKGTPRKSENGAYVPTEMKLRLRVSFRVRYESWSQPVIHRAQCFVPRRQRSLLQRKKKKHHSLPFYYVHTVQ
jgi:hypothetical protein